MCANVFVAPNSVVLIPLAAKALASEYDVVDSRVSIKKGSRQRARESGRACEREREREREYLRVRVRVHVRAGSFARQFARVDWRSFFDVRWCPDRFQPRGDVLGELPIEQRSFAKHLHRGF